MSDISDITTKVRYLIEDFLRTQSPGDIFVYGSSSVFTLSETNIVSITSVLVNSSAISSGNYSFNSTTNKLTITSSLTSGDVVEIRYTYYCSFSDAEIEFYIRGAAVHISINNYQTWEIDTSDNFYPDPNDQEKNLIALVAATLIKPPQSSIRLPDLSISYPETMNLNDKISKIIRTFKTNSFGRLDIIGPEQC